MTAQDRPGPQPGDAMNVSAIVRMNLAAMDTPDLKLLRGALLLDRIGTHQTAEHVQRAEAMLAAVQDEIDQRQAARDTAGPASHAGDNPGSDGGTQ